MSKTVIRVILILAAIFGMRACIESQEQFSCDGATVVVQSGDTVWGLIEQHCTGNKESARSHIVGILGGANLDPGQVITMPGK